MRIRWLPVVGLLALGGLAQGVKPAETAAQGVQELAAACAGEDPIHVDRCRDAALTARELQGGMGLAVSGGSLLGGSGSTLGHRMEGRPRVSLDIGGNLARIRHPDLLGGQGDPAAPTRRTAPRLGAGVTLGVFDGFAPLPTVGGVLSVDLVARGNVVSLPRDEGFSSSLAAYGAGVRVGLLRESFTLPGVTFSAAHHRMGSFRFGSLLAGDPARIDLDPRATSLRLVTEKDVRGAGLMAGTGWDRVQGTVRAEVAGDGDGGSVERLRSSRPTLFAGGNITYLVLRVSAELGWAPSHDGVAEWGDRPFQPESAWYGTLGLRVTY